MINGLKRGRSGRLEERARAFYLRGIRRWRSARGFASAAVAQPRLLGRIVRLRLVVPRQLRSMPLPLLLDQLTMGGATNETRVPSQRMRKGHEEVVGVLTGRILARPSPLATTCLYRAIIRYALLAPRAKNISLVLGLDCRSQPFRGHAWLERHGMAIYEGQPLVYHPTFRYPG